jgi:hypothetical protein
MGVKRGCILSKKERKKERGKKNGTLFFFYKTLHRRYYVLCRLVTILFNSIENVLLLSYFLWGKKKEKWEKVGGEKER